MKWPPSFMTTAALMGILAASITMPARADAMYCSGFAAGYKDGYCSKAVRMSSCNPQGIECDSLTAEGYASGYVNGQRVGLAAATPKPAEESHKSTKPVAH